MPGKSFLSKSTFIRGIQCEKSFYLNKKRPFLRDRLSEEQLAKFRRGHKVGEMARGLFPGGIDVSPKSHFQMDKAIKKTAELIQAGAPVIYEASFEHQGVRVAVDILYNDNGLWKAVEVKSSAAISEIYLWDAALQYHVITGSGLPLDDFMLSYINYGYVRNGEVSVQELFVVESVLGLVLRKLDDVRSKIEKLRNVNQLTSSPEVAVGPHCIDPYPCDFIGHCWKKTGIRPDVLQIESDLNAISDVKTKFGEPAAIYSSLHYKPAVPPYNGFSPYQKLSYSFRFIPYADRGQTGFSHVAKPFEPVTCEELSALFELAKAYNTIIVFDKEAEIEKLMLICHDKPAFKHKVSALNHKMLGLKQAYVGKDNLLSDNQPPKNAEEALSALGVMAVKPSDRFTTYLEASSYFDDVINGLADEADLPAIAAFHDTCLQNLKLLHDHTLNV